jgi:hypothetical protein
LRISSATTPKPLPCSFALAASSAALTESRLDCSATWLEVPMISSGYKFMRLIIDSGMRGGIPKEKHKNVVTMYGDVEKYMKELNLEAQFGHAFLLDKEGIIRWQGKGFATPESLKELFALAEKIAEK